LPKGRGWSPLTWQILEGKNEIPVTLFEAKEEVDSGPIYLQSIMRFRGHELVDELREKQAIHTVQLCLEFIRRYPKVTQQARQQQGEPRFYPKRGPKDSWIDPDKTIREQFNLLRVVDNDSYPAWFEMGGQRYELKIEKKKY
jgi:methionyl-tRNA formyltransferase